MKFTNASSAERAALVRMVHATVELIVVIGRAIKNGRPGFTDTEGVISAFSEEFIDAIIGVQESEEKATRESHK